jgi:rhamnogalacturonan endolyase
MTRKLWMSLVCVCLAAPVRAGKVEVADSPDSYTLSNGVLTAKVDKRSGNLASLRYHDTEILDPNARRPEGFWSHSASSPDMTRKITIDPKSNNGERGEVSVKGISHGNPMGSGPGGSAIADIEIRWSLGADDSAIYTYSIWEHQKDYPRTSVGEARFCAKLNDSVFDWMTVDAKRNMLMPTAYDWNHGTVMNMKEVRLLNSGVLKGHVEHKYDYSANQFDVLAWGWSSTKQKIRVYFINPTIEYLSGGPTKIELSAHRDATFNPEDKTAPAPPCLLNYWRGSHYGGSSIVVEQGEHWAKVIGPFAIYCNSTTASDAPDALWKDALARTPKETAAWPYAWVNHPDYPLKDERATVTGQLVLNDPQSGASILPHLLVGLTYPDYTVSGFRGQQTIDWQMDAKHYEFWTRGNPDGTFSIPAVRAGKYTLHAIADNVLGEFAKTDITIEPGKSIDLGKLEWKPVRYGKQLWDIGVPDRTCAEFKDGDRAYSWGLYNEYPKIFPNDVHYVIGQSDYHKDWYLMQVPRARDDSSKGAGDATTWTIQFTLPDQAKGKATLRLAFAGTEAKSLNVAVNDKPVTTISGLPNTSSIHRDSDRSYWEEKAVPFDANLLKSGTNTIALTVPAGPVTAGVMYDYLRLELDESAKPATPTP